MFRNYSAQKYMQYLVVPNLLQHGHVEMQYKSVEKHVVVMVI